MKFEDLKRKNLKSGFSVIREGKGWRIAITFQCLKKSFFGFKQWRDCCLCIPYVLRGQRNIGHNLAETTLNIYTHITDEMQKSAAEKIGRNLRQDTNLSNKDSKP